VSKIDPADIPRDTRQAQQRATLPHRSVWVSAHAGAGKTHVLAGRVIRLLLDGVEPERILCVTYTKAAAANMASRVFERLRKWTEVDDAALAGQLADMLERRASPGEMARARRLFAAALETPGGVKIQTIHAFCQAVLHRFPIEANIGGHFELMDALATDRVTRQLRRRFLTPGSAVTTQGLDAAVEAIITRHGETKLEKLFDAIAENRDGLAAYLDELREDAGPASSLPALYPRYGFAAGESEATIAASVWPLPQFSAEIVDDLHQRASDISASNALKVFSPLQQAFTVSDPLLRFECLQSAFLTSTAQIKSTTSLFKKPLGTDDLIEAFLRAGNVVHDANQRLMLLRNIRSTEQALVLADHFIAAYAAEKQHRGLLDYNDLIERTAAMLARSDIGPWVHYKLDTGIDHILIDEAQDTAPRQWDVLTPLAAEIHDSLLASNRNRTIFAVGDIKQSIYSFQGARPEEFARKGEAFSAQMDGDPDRFKPESLPTSFRSVPDILKAVDLTFAQPDMRAALGSDEPLRHEALLNKASGEVQLWDMIVADSTIEEEDWTAPIDLASAPEVRLAEQIARVIRRWIDVGEHMPAKGRAIEEGDILILVRKRSAFIHDLARKLKAVGLAVAGTDKLTLTDHIAVQDLLALGRFLIQPADDLALAAVLRSPVFAMDEQALEDIAAHRAQHETLEAALHRHAGDDAHLASIVDRIDEWRLAASMQPAFDFYAGLLAAGGLRQAFLARLGREVEDILDEFLKFVRAEEEEGRGTLVRFLHAALEQAPVVKREMDQAANEIRIMTAHGAKGLEAPVVFVVDPGGAAYNSRFRPPLVVDASASRDGVEAWVWLAAADEKFDKEALEQPLKTLAEAEYRRLLYVAMTRAEDRLILCGHASKSWADGKHRTWHHMVHDALAADAARLEAPEGFSYWHYAPHAGQGRAPAADDRPTNQTPLDSSPPHWAGTRAAVEHGLPRPLSPSGASALIEDDLGAADDMSVSPVLGPLENRGSANQAFALRRGHAIHRLFEVLPTLAPDQRNAAAQAWLARAFPREPEAIRFAIASDVFRIVENPATAMLFGPGSSAEVPVMGMLDVRGETRAITGIIDRLAVSGDAVVIADFKTDRNPPQTAADVPARHCLQLALYRHLVARLYPDRPVRALLVYTAGPHVVTLPGEMLDAALAAITAT
jgi:ATP-dependent helicase/nuclease subunit A